MGGCNDILPSDPSKKAIGADITFIPLIQKVTKEMALFEVG
jgi:hypothetical protein